MVITDNVSADVTFKERTGFPTEATREQLEESGARYLATEPFDRDGKSKKIENMIYENNGQVYVWKRVIPDQELFKIHLEAKIEKRYDNDK